MNAPAGAPSRIGRYEVVGKLAQGGMAEILLGRLTGPSGFERSVVIKRILPTYAELPTFVDMFLDEARIAARINHPNVVQHQELGQEGVQLFLVMEYVEGESLSSLQRRLCSRGVPLRIEQAAFIVAEAAAGLHAAHEMTDIDGSPLNIVHRDISPQNIFITYRGNVKVMDFGIAKAADSISVTEAGELKGKFEYMSPEQSMGEPLDRRSDVFALGIVLYELMTGRRVFRRATRLASLRAVREAAIPKPSSIVPDLPESFERICMKALSREPADRYPDMATMRDELLAAIRQSSAPWDLERDLGALMMELFADRMADKQEMLRRVSIGGALSQVPSAEVDKDVQIPSVLVTTLPEPPPSSPTRSPRVVIVLAIAAAIATVAAVGATWVATKDSASAPSETVESVPPRTAGPERAAESERPSTVTLHVDTSPPGASVSIDGVDRGQTPLEIALGRSEVPVPMTLSRVGFRPLSVEVSPDLDQRLHYSLTRAPRARPTMRLRSMATREPEKSTSFPRFN